jgi:hypothetical protein
MNGSLRINASVLMVAHKLELENNNAFQISMTQKKILENSNNFICHYINLKHLRFGVIIINYINSFIKILMFVLCVTKGTKAPFFGKKI